MHATFPFSPSPERIDLRDRVDPRSAPLEAEDFLRLQSIDEALARGLDLRRWWFKAAGSWAFETLDESKLVSLLASGIHPKTFRLTQPAFYWPETMGYGFFDTAVVENRPMPVYGFVQQTAFDRPMILHSHIHHKTDRNPLLSRHHEDLLESWRDGFREFVWKHFLRVTHFVQPNIPYSDPAQRPLDSYLRPLSWRFPRAEDVEPQKGITNRQLYYKIRHTQKIGKFRKSDENDIDLRKVNIDGDFSWIVFRMESHQSNRKELLEPQWLSTSPLNRINYGILSHPFMHQEETQRPGERRGLYSFGFAVDRDPISNYRERTGFIQVQFSVQGDGTILARIVFVRARPRKFLLPTGNPFTRGAFFMDRALQTFLAPSSHTSNSPTGSPKGPDPLHSFIRLINAATNGWTARHLGITLEQLQTRLLVEGALEFLEIIDSVLPIWRAIPDWTADDCLPDWLR